MSLASVQRQLDSRSLAESGGISNAETPRHNRHGAKDLSTRTESPESKSMSYACARARARTVEPGKRYSADSRDSAPPRFVTVLKYCRCQDCRHWIGEPYSECVRGIIVNGLKEPPAYPPDAWHYCALYHGPQISKDVWVWPKGSPLGGDVGPRSQESSTTATTTPNTPGANTGERGPI